ncbi:FAD-binding oxidoreductase [Herbaspirillum sp. RV1423]|uniref:NAD(P)/FAD-dependent oxidoreductase n=1 Tax=Herbaspirillum sp. RV1423 TaxID=1443993 RepID=UPI0004AF80DC|nr:FAD-dependent oxidoreductase [Herbaspirillum sp. RV1423]
MHIVIGAGVIGASLAFHLARAGAPVAVIDAGRIGGGTSASSFAWVNSHNKAPRAYHDLNVAGMRAHADLRAAFGHAPWWHGGGTIEWEGIAPEAYRRKIALLQSWGYAAQWLDHDQLRALEPDIDPAAVGDAPVAFFPDDGWVDPVVYSHALLADAQRHGAKVFPHLAVTAIRRQGSRVVGVTTADGVSHDADVVINCTGRWADQAALPAALRIPLAPSAGLMVFTPSLAHGVQRVIFSPRVHIHPDGAGRLLICRNDLEVAADAEFDSRSPEVTGLLAAAREVLPLLRGVDAEALRVGVRAIPADQFPAVGPSPDTEGYYSIVTHSGVTLAPFLGAAAADEILNNAVRPELETFRPRRFFL